MNEIIDAIIKFIAIKMGLPRQFGIAKLKITNEVEADLYTLTVQRDWRNQPIVKYIGQSDGYELFFYRDGNWFTQILNIKKKIKNGEVLPKEFGQKVVEDSLGQKYY